MTSESDGTPHLRPPTIDLTATEVAPERPAEPEATVADEATPAVSVEPSDSQSSAPRLRSAVIPAALAAGVVSGIAVAAVIVALQATGHWPVSEAAPPAAPAPAASNDTAIADLTAQVNKIQSALAAQKPDPTLATQLAAVQATTKSLGDSLTALSGKVDQTNAAAQSAQAQAKTASDTASATRNAAQSGVSRSDLDALTGRVAALEGTVKSLSDAVSHQAANDGTARMMVVTEALRAAVERGTPFQAELAAAKTLGVDQTLLAPLAPFAASGVPSAAALGKELATLSPALTEAVEPKQTQSTFLDRIEVNAQRLVRSTPLDAPAGDDPRSVAIRIGFDASHGDIDAALADIAKLPDAAKTIAAPWVQKAQARNAALAASLKLTANALAALSKPQ
jgi:hypothetical protein